MSATWFCRPTLAWMPGSTFYVGGGGDYGRFVVWLGHLYLSFGREDQP